MLVELGKKLNAATSKNLIEVLQNVTTINNLFVPSRELSSLLNYLTPFLVLKKTGNFDKTLWLDALVESRDIHSILESYSIIILIRPCEEDLQLLLQLWRKVRHTAIITLVVKDLTRSFYYEILTRMLESKKPLLEEIRLFNDDLPVLTLTKQCQLMSWKTYPVCIHDFVFSLEMDDGGLSLYFHNPLDQISRLSHAVVDILKYSTTQHDILKLKNAFSKGDHATLLLNTLLNDRVPEMLAKLFSVPEQDFFQNKLRGNTDVVVLERNLDYFPLLLSHTNYMGFLDDMVGTKDEYSGELNGDIKVSDATFDILKHINVSSIELVLSDIARKLIAEEKELKDKNYGKTQSADLRTYASEAKVLANRKEEVEKHLDLIREAMAQLDANKSGNESYDIRKEWLGLQNDLFDSDYKHRLATIFSMINKYCSFEMVASLVVLVSLSSDGIYQSDYDRIELDVAVNFGLASALALRKLHEYNLVRITESGTFLGNFTFGRTETTTTSTAGAISASGEALEERSYDDISLLGVTGGQDVYRSTYTLISKFWNLHPYEESQGVVKSVTDYNLPNFALSSNTVPLTCRIVESLYFRDFLTYTPVNNIHRRPNWEKLNLDTMVKGQTVDRNICDDQEKGDTGDKLEFVIVILVGGITRAEISVLQHLQTRLRKKLLVVTSGIVNNRKLMATMEQM